ncbi:MAG: hypothetical protein NXI31_27015 [bacterium]|nr:hypothetical protein [bacterium]
MVAQPNTRPGRRTRGLRVGRHVEVAIVLLAVLGIGAGLGMPFAFLLLTPSPLLLPVVFGAVRGGLLPALTAATLAAMLHALAVVVAAGHDFAALLAPDVGWAVFAFCGLGYLVGQARDLLAERVARLQERREALQVETWRHQHDLEILEHANGELQRRIFDRSFDLDSLVATVARSTLEHDEHMFEPVLGMLTDFCGASKCSVLLVLADGTLDLAAHRGWGDAEIGPRLRDCNRSARLMRAIIEAQPIVELADESEGPGPLFVAPVADGTGAIKVLVCIDELPPVRFDDGLVKTFLGIATWLAANLRRVQMRESAGENRQQLLLALERTKHIGTAADLAERIHLEDSRRRRYGVDTELIVIRLLDMRITIEGCLDGLETRLLHVLTTTVRVTDDVFSFGFAGCYVLLVTGCGVEHAAELVHRLEDRFRGCEGPEFGPVDVQHFATTTAAPTLAALLPAVTEHFCGTSPIPLSQQCPVPDPRPQRGGNAAAFARRLRLESDLAERLGTELHMIDFRREGPSFGVGPMIARHLWNSVGTLLRVTDGIYVINPNRCAVLLPCTSCVDASVIWSRLDETLRSTLPADHYDGVRCDFLALEPEHLRETVEYLTGSLGPPVDSESPTGLLSENELAELASELGDLGGESDLERDLEVASTADAQLALPSPEDVARRWDEVFDQCDDREQAGSAAPDSAGLHGESDALPEREPRQIVLSEGLVPRLPDGDAIRRRWDEVFESASDESADERAPSQPVIEEPAIDESAVEMSASDERELPVQEPDENTRNQEDDVKTKESTKAEPAVPAAVWRTAAAKLLDELAGTGQPFTSADLRRAAIDRGVGEPGHPNAWGALMTAASRRGEIQKTGRRVPSTMRGRNAAKVAEWIGCERSGVASVPRAEDESLAGTLTELRGEIEALRAELAAADEHAVEPPPKPVDPGVDDMPADRETWRTCVAGIVAEFASGGQPFTSADVRTVAGARGVGEPEHANAWGAAMAAAHKQSLITKTGRFVGVSGAGRTTAPLAEWVGLQEAAGGEGAAGNAVVDVSSLQAQVDELRRLLTAAPGSTGRGDAGTGGTRPGQPSVPAATGPTASEDRTLLLLQAQIEGLFALCLRHAPQPGGCERRV